jgi:3-dehydroquinate dehydratase/shikimate dehydrogenase
MLCVTGSEASVAALARRVADADRRAGATLLHELRLDLVERIEWAALLELVRREGQRLLLCCRAERQGGGWRGSEEDRVALLAYFFKQGGGWVDLEADVEDETLERFDRQRVVLSWHEPEVEGDAAERARRWQARLEAMARRSSGLVKLAVAVEDAAELEALRAARAAVPPGRGAIVIGMGAAGALSRSRYRRFGSAWCYVAAHADGRTAAGQLTLDEALALGLPRANEAPFYALVGGPGVSLSPGPRVYNAFFRAQRMLASYVAQPVRSLAATLPLFEALGARGLSVTMPHKQEALALCRPDAVARRIGAVNSLRRDRDGVWSGTNTDVEGVRAPLARALARSGGTRALVLGAGGAARAAVVACRDLGLDVAVAARDPSRARALLASVVGPEATAGAIAWEARADAGADVVVNATPLGGARTPWPEGCPLGARVVFDLALATEPSRLLAVAAAGGSATLDGRAMWIHQGARQMSWMLGRPIDARDLEEYL